MSLPDLHYWPEPEFAKIHDYIQTCIYTLCFPFQAKCSSWTDSLMVPSLTSVLRWNTEILFCTFYPLKLKRTKIEIQLFNWWIAAGNRLCWERPGGPAGPDDLHLPKDDQVHLPQVRHQRRGQKHLFCFFNLKIVFHIYPYLIKNL